MAPSEFALLTDDDDEGFVADERRVTSPEASRNDTRSQSITPRPAASATEPRSENMDNSKEDFVAAEYDDDFDNVAMIGYDDPAPQDDQASEKSVPASKDHDTIASAEEFTMISFDSMPSFQQHQNARKEELPDIGDETSLIINRTLESLRQGPDNDSLDLVETASARSDISVAGTSPRSALATPKLTTEQNPGPETPTPERLTRSPRKSKTATPLRQQLLTAQASMHPSPMAVTPSRNSGRPSSRSSATPKTAATAAAIEDSDSYEDSFSEIPEAVLEAATPRRIVLAATLHAVSPLVQQELSSHSRASQPAVPDRSNAAASENSRLPTPEETPSPDESLNMEPEEKDSTQSGTDSALPSSPPVAGPMKSLRMDSSTKSQRQSTPPLNLEFSLPNLPEVTVEPFAVARRIQKNSQRPPLSPIARVGLPLQTIMSEPSTPRSERSTLGSPFRDSRNSGSRNGSVTRPERAKTPEGAKTPEEPGSFNLWAQAFGSNTRAARQPVIPAPVKFAFESKLPSDPFGPSPARPSGARTNQPAAATGSGMAALRASMASSTRISPPRGAEMSWMPDPTPVRFDYTGVPIVPITEKQSSPGHTGVEAPEVVNQEEADEEAVEDDDDIWQVEAQRAPPRPQTSRPIAPPTLFNRLRIKVSSPWRTVEPIGPKAAAAAEPKAATPAPIQPITNTPEPVPNADDELDEYSMLASNFGSKKATAEKDKASVGQPAKIDLSAFFSSPAPFPMLLPKALQKLPPAPTPTDRAPAEEPKQPSSSKLKSAVASSFSKPIAAAHPLSRSDTISSAASPSSPAQDEEVPFEGPSTPAQLQFTPIPQKMNFTPRPRQAGQSPFGANPLFSRGEPAQEVVEMAAAPQEREEPEDVNEPAEEEMADEDDDDEHEEEEASVVVHSEDSPSHIQQEQEEEKDDSPFHRPLLRPLPNHGQTPTKSCLRSPLKPSTPGRVVAFTSSTLSPLAERDQQQQAMPQLQSAHPQSQLYPQRQPQQQHQQRVQMVGITNVPRLPHPLATGFSVDDAAMDEEKENQGENGSPNKAKAQLQFQMPKKRTPSRLFMPLAAMSQSTFLPARAAPPPALPTRPTTTTTTAANPTFANPTAAPARLSPTTWSRAHWLRLDELLQRRRRGVFTDTPYYRQSTPRSYGGLLGKDVAAQGERMTLERWHLEVVDAFRAEVGGFDERELARRLFALVVGEQRRKEKRRRRAQAQSGRALGEVQA